MLLQIVINRLLSRSVLNFLTNDMCVKLLVFDVDLYAFYLVFFFISYLIFLYLPLFLHFYFCILLYFTYFLYIYIVMQACNYPFLGYNKVYLES